MGPSVIPIMGLTSGLLSCFPRWMVALHWRPSRLAFCKSNSKQQDFGLHQDFYLPSLNVWSLEGCGLLYQNPIQACPWPGAQGGGAEHIFEHQGLGGFPAHQHLRPRAESTASRWKGHGRVPCMADCSTRGDLRSPHYCVLS